MKFLSLLTVLLLEQLRPLRQGNPFHLGFDRYALALEGHFNGGRYGHGAIAWTLAVAPVVGATIVIFNALYAISPIAGWIWNVVVLYLTVGFRRFSRHFTDIQSALRGDDLGAARECLGNWSGEPAAELSAGEVARVAIERGLLDSHRHVFGALFWFLALGPAGPVLYRAASVLAERWGSRAEAGSGEFGRFAAQAFYWLDWVPARLTAASFAVVGDFEDAIYCWRSQAAAWPARAEGILLASGAGALGVRLGDTLHQYGSLRFRPELGIGEEAEPEHLQQAVGLIWRSLVLWMFLLLVVSIAYALG